MNLKCCLALTLLLCSTLCVWSQTNNGNLRLEFKLDANSATIDTNENYQTSTKYEVLYHLPVNDSIEIKKIEVKFGTTKGGSQYFSSTINANGQNLPQGFSIINAENEIIVNTGKYAITAAYYAKARFKYTDGSYSEWMEIGNAE